MTYHPKRCSKKWLDADCPKGVLAILDNPKFADRYTVIYAKPIVTDGTFAGTYLGYRGMSEKPSDPQGVGLYGELTAYDAAAYRYRNKHRYTKWSSLPDAVKRCVLADLKTGDT